MLECLHGTLKPIVRLLLLCGIGYTEFEAAAKGAFIQVASEDYGIRGRPTNASRVAAMTGLSRKEVGRIRADTFVTRWSPEMETTPINTILHFWHFDPDFSEKPGKPKTLPLEGDPSLATLVKRYAGDIPPGAVKAELCRMGTAIEQPGGTLLLVKRYSFPTSFHEDYVRKLGYALENLGNTLVHNAVVRGAGTGKKRTRAEEGWFERCAHSRRLPADSIRDFENWVRSEGETFLERADHWIGTHEIPHSALEDAPQKDAGVGVYFFIEE
jgi:hypothetical protein